MSRSVEKDVLFTGNVSMVSDAFFQAFGKDYRCVVFCEKEKRKFSGKNVLTYWKKDEDHETASVFAAFCFETVVYFSYTLDGVKQPFGELERLENTLYYCRKNGVKHFYYIMCNNLPLKEREQIEERGYLILKDACESLCRHAAESDGIAVEILKVPYLYRTGQEEESMPFLKDALEKGKVIFPGGADFLTDFLCDADLGELMVRILDDPMTDDFIILHIGGGNPHTFQELGELFQKQLPKLQIEYGNGYDCIPRCRKSEAPRKEYGWHPVKRLEDHVSGVIAETLERKKRQHFLYTRREKRKEWSEKLRVGAELIILFLVTELLNQWTRDNVMVNFIDFRLIYVVMMGMMNGLNAGALAALLSSIGYVISHITQTPWQILFYNVQNWLPFACYFLLGSISGYTRDKHDDETLYAREEYGILEDKYVFLSRLYREVLAGKTEFNHQIIGYRDSYGKLYSIVKKLDALLPEQVFYEAVSILEETLGNTYVAIYSIDCKSAFARLNICSKNCRGLLERSMRMTDYPDMLRALKANEVFENKKALADYPVYATPILRNEELVGMILLLRAESGQMNMEFSNKFRIITDLIRDSLLRAMDYHERNTPVLEDTRILNAGSFREVLAVKRQMRQKQYLEYILVRIHSNGRSLKELGNMVAGLVRSNDVLGQGEDGELYLLLSQTRQEDWNIVKERLNSKRLKFELVRE